MLRTLLRTVALGALLFAVVPADAAPTTWKIDAGHSTILFKVKHMNVGWAYGRFNKFSGAVVVDDENLANASVEIEVETSSVDTADAARDEHLRKPDFFHCEKFPTMGFESTAVKKEGAVYVVTGNLTLLGTTKPVTMRMDCLGEANDPWGNRRKGFEGTFSIKRSEYGMNQHLDGIGDDVHVTVAIETILAK